MHDTDDEPDNTPLRQRLCVYTLALAGISIALTVFSGFTHEPHERSIPFRPSVMTAPWVEGLPLPLFLLALAGFLSLAKPLAVDIAAFAAAGTCFLVSWLILGMQTGFLRVYPDSPWPLVLEICAGGIAAITLLLPRPNLPRTLSFAACLCCICVWCYIAAPYFAPGGILATELVIDAVEFDK